MLLEHIMTYIIFKFLYLLKIKKQKNRELSAFKGLDDGYKKIVITMDIDASIKVMWYRFSRRNDDFCVESSFDGINFKQMRICHMFNVKDAIKFGIYACSPEDSSFKAHLLI